MSNPTQQLTVADIELARMNIQAGIVGTGALSIASICIGIVEDIVSINDDCDILKAFTKIKQKAISSLGLEEEQ